MTALNSFWSINAFVLTLAVAVIYVDRINSSVYYDTYTRFRVVPDLLSYPPRQGIQITYPNNVKVLYGNSLNTVKAVTKPKFEFAARQDQLYTLLMVDPDALSPLLPLANSVAHFIVANIPGNKVEEGDVIVDYKLPVPPPALGPHRYTFILYQQNGRLNEKIMSSSINRKANFDLRKFAKRNHLGYPVAANFFIGEYL